MAARRDEEGYRSAEEETSRQFFELILEDDAWVSSFDEHMQVPCDTTRFPLFARITL